MRVFHLHALVAAAALLLSTPLYAQQDEVVVVSATRFADDARRLPASVTVLSAEDIANSAARTLPDLLSEQIGISLKDFYGNNAAFTSIDLRGFGVTGGQNTLILLDGRRITDIDLSSVQWSSVPLSLIERIEILRGTGAVLYGDGASAGVINIVTRSPLKPGVHAQMHGRAGSYNTREGQFTGGVATETFGFNASVYGFSSDGYRTNNRNEQVNYSANMRWGSADSSVDLRLGKDRQDLRLPGARRIQPSLGLDEYATDRRGAQTPLDYASRDGARAGLTLAHRLGETELTLGIDYRDKDQRSYFDQGGFPIYRADALNVTSLTPRARVPFQIGTTSHRLTIGVDTYRWRYDRRSANLPENVARPINLVRVAQDSTAIYLQDAVQLNSATGLALGWRQERRKIVGTDAVDAAAPGFFFNTAATQAAAIQRQNAWEMGLKHALDAHWSGFARAVRSLRFVNVDEIYENDAFFNAQFQILRPQHAITREIGTEWRRGKLNLRAALFRTDVTDEIHLDPFTTGVGNSNLPPSRRQGVEIGASWRPTPELGLTAGYAYTDARFRQGVLPGNVFAIGTNLEIAGRRVPLVPEHKLNLGFAWDVAAKTRLSGTLGYVSSQFMDNDEPNTLGTKIPAYSVVDLKAARDFGFARIGLAVNNLLNEKYYNYAVRSAFTPDRYAVYPLPGRTLGLTAEIKL
ncbi:MAG: TonB-dependent receptor [Betaproteobacteria bacterium]|nr:TonB-dependent receptor [Betaproteobacteria bacterium]